MPRPRARLVAHAAIYQIYVRSFADGNGDGIGDLAGIRDRLPYLRDLGVDALWITPWYASPMADGGYDVADYRDIDPIFGTLAEAEALIARGPRPRPAGHRRPGAQPLLRPAPLVPGSARGRPRVARARALLVPCPAGRATATAAQRLAVVLRRPRLDPGHRGRRHPGPLVPAPVRPAAARPELGTPRGARRVRGHPALLARPRRGRLPHRRGPRPGQEARAARRRPRPRPARPALPGPRRGPRDLPRLAQDRSTRYDGERVFVGEVWLPDPDSSPATCAPTSCTPRSTSTSCAAPGTPALRDGHRPAPSPRTPPSARRPPGSCPTTTRSATSPATAARTPRSTWATSGSAPPATSTSAGAGPGPRPC